MEINPCPHGVYLRKEVDSTQNKEAIYLKVPWGNIKQGWGLGVVGSGGGAVLRRVVQEAPRDGDTGAET